LVNQLDIFCWQVEENANRTIAPPQRLPLDAAPSVILIFPVSQMENVPECGLVTFFNLITQRISNAGQAVVVVKHEV